jgi:hypothetical protein
MTGVVAAMDRFGEFVARSKALVATAGMDDTTVAFRRFVERAHPLLVEPMSEKLTTLRSRVSLLRPWITSWDLLAVAGLDYAEDPYTELVAWALHPDTRPPSAERRQRAWLDSLSLGGGIGFAVAAEPRTQLPTTDGVPDLILRYDEFVVVVEAKTGSTEHLTRGGRPQTFAYVEAVAKTLGLPSEVPVHVIYLTPDRRAAANPEAVCTSHVDFVVALAGAFEPDELPENARVAFKMLFTHFALHAVPLGYDSRALLLEQPSWLAPDIGTAEILGHLEVIHDAIAVFLPGGSR